MVQCSGKTKCSVKPLNNERIGTANLLHYMEVLLIEKYNLFKSTQWYTGKIEL